jgi:hypothetical protein
VSNEIHKAMVGISRKIASEGIGKTRKNTQQGYNFRGVDEVMQAFAPILAEQGVFVCPKFFNRTVVERQTKTGGAIFYTVIEGEFTFTHEDGSSISVGPFYGEAMDSGDKSSNKAMAVAFKYAMFQTFCVPLEGVTGGDADLQTHEVQPYTGKPMDGVWEGCSAEDRLRIESVSVTIGEYADMEDYKGAHEYVHGLGLESEDKMRLWSLLPSKTRSALKREQANEAA